MENIFYLIAYVIVLFVPSIKILQRTGHPLWYAILSVIPGINLIALWALAFSRWPNRRRLH